MSNLQSNPNNKYAEIQLITGRIVSGNPFGRSTATNRYEITIAVNENHVWTRSFFQKTRGIIEQHWPNAGLMKNQLMKNQVEWNLEEYDDEKPYVEYCSPQTLLIHISEEQSPLIVMSDGKGGWKPIECSCMIKTGDYVNVELELVPNSGKVNPSLHLKANFIALNKIGEEVDLEYDIAKKRREMLLEELPEKLGKSPDLVK